jgi:hypothetical protein
VNSLPDWNLTRYPHETVPPLEAVRSADFVLLVGQFTNTAWAEQLAGLLENVIPEGTVLIVAFPPQVAGALEPLLARLGVGYVPASISPVKVVTIHPAFTEYFALFGQSAARFEPDQATEVLGETHAPEGDRVPAAVSVSRGRGAIYAVPFFFAGAEAQFAPMLSAAITAHLADSAAVPPPFLAGLRLPREQDLLDEIDEFGDKAPGAPGGSGVPGTLSPPARPPGNRYRLGESRHRGPECCLSGHGV